MKKIILLFSFFFFGCHYHTDKLRISNNSDKEVYYMPLFRNSDDANCYALSVGGNVRPRKEHSPKLRGTIWYKMKEKEFDSLYIVFFDKKYFKYASENEKKIVYDKRFKVQKYSLKELDSLNWTITYDGN